MFHASTGFSKNAKNSGQPSINLENLKTDKIINKN